MITVTIEYFAILREYAGVNQETLQTDAGTPAQLFVELEALYGFPELETMKVAINDEFDDWDAQLNDGDSIVFIPPVAGG